MFLQRDCFANSLVQISLLYSFLSTFPVEKLRSYSNYSVIDLPTGHADSLFQTSDGARQQYVGAIKNDSVIEVNAGRLNKQLRVIIHKDPRF